MLLAEFVAAMMMESLSVMLQRQDQLLKFWTWVSQSFPPDPSVPDP